MDDLGRVRLVRSVDEVAGSPTPSDVTAGVKVQSLFWKPTGGFSYEATSNPYRAATSAAQTASDNPGWTRTKRDQLGRVVEVESFSGAVPPAPWRANATSTGKTSTSDCAGTVQVTDPSLNVKTMEYDGLKRLTSVVEACAGY